MKKIVKLTENDLTRIVKRVINENDRVYGYDNIKSLEKNLKDDEYIDLDDSSGDLSGSIVGKIEYLRKMLRYAVDNESWSGVERALSFIDSEM
jgi:hypothetical protein